MEWSEHHLRLLNCPSCDQNKSPMMAGFWNICWGFRIPDSPDCTCSMVLESKGAQHIMLAYVCVRFPGCLESRSDWKVAWDLGEVRQTLHFCHSPRRVQIGKFNVWGVNNRGWGLFNDSCKSQVCNPAMRNKSPPPTSCQAYPGIKHTRTKVFVCVTWPHEHVELNALHIFAETRNGILPVRNTKSAQHQ